MYTAEPLAPALLLVLLDLLRPPVGLPAATTAVGVADVDEAVAAAAAAAAAASDDSMDEGAAACPSTGPDASGDEKRRLCGDVDVADAGAGACAECPPL